MDKTTFKYDIEDVVKPLGISFKSSNEKIQMNTLCMCTYTFDLICKDCTYKYSFYTDNSWYLCLSGVWVGNTIDEILNKILTDNAGKDVIHVPSKNELRTTGQFSSNSIRVQEYSKGDTHLLVLNFCGKLFAFSATMVIIHTRLI